MDTNTSVEEEESHHEEEGRGVVLLAAGIYVGMLVFVFVMLQTWLSYGADECPARP
jgi:hypothetical protein